MHRLVQGETGGTQSSQPKESSPRKSRKQNREHTEGVVVNMAEGLAELGLGVLGGLEALNLILWQGGPPLRSMVTGVAGPEERGS